MNTLSEHDLKEFEAILKRALDPIRKRLKAIDLKLKKIIDDQRKTAPNLKV